MPRHSETTTSAIKNAVDIVALVGEYLPLRRAGTKYKALCPFHDDHNPSLELNPERQSYKCWSCGAGGDIFDFVKNIEHVDFPEALRMLADRAGVALESPPSTALARSGAVKTELLEVNAWAEEVFAQALPESAEVLDYVDGRGLSRQSVERFRLGYAPEARGWLLAQARRQRIQYGGAGAGRAGQPSPESPGLVRERFRGRLMFPIHDDRGTDRRVRRADSPGGRTSTGRRREAGREISQHARDLAVPQANDPVRGRPGADGEPRGGLGGRGRGLYRRDRGPPGRDSATSSARWERPWARTTFAALRRLSDRVVLVFDGDEAGQSAADRALELFLGKRAGSAGAHLAREPRPLRFPSEGGGRRVPRLAERAADPLAYLLDPGLGSVRPRLGRRLAPGRRVGPGHPEPGARRRISLGLEVKMAKVLDTLSHRLRVPLETLNGLRQQLRRSAAQPSVGRRAPGNRRGRPCASLGRPLTR